MALEHKDIKKKTSKEKGIDQESLSKPVNTIKQLKEYLNLHYEIRLNWLTYETEIREYTTDDFKVLDDFNFNDIYLSMREQGYKCSASLLERLLKSSFATGYNPFKKYFDSLPPHDGVDYIKELADTVKIEDLSSNHIKLQELWMPFLTKWLVASVAQVLGIGKNHTCLVLVGGQGAGKTQWLNKLCPKVLDEYQVCSHINPSLTDQNTNNYLAEKWFVNIDDQLETIFGKDFNSMKAIITTPTVTNRKVYARITKKRPRVCSFMGSVNNAKFLTDTQNRRYLVFSVTSIDYQHKIDMDKVWAQAFSIAKTKFHYWLDAKEISELNQINEIYRQSSPEEEWLLKLYNPCEANDPNAHFMMASEMLSHMNAHSGLRLSPKRLSQAMDKLGYGTPISKRLEGMGPRKVYPVRLLSDEHENKLQRELKKII